MTEGADLTTRADQTHAHPDEDRRGRRASWIALALATVVCVALAVSLRDEYAAARYTSLRVHVTRPQRAAIEQAIARGHAAASRVTLLVTIDGCEPGSGWRLPHPGYRTLDSLAALGHTMTLDGEADQVALAIALAVAAGAHVHTEAVPGRVEDLDLTSLRAAFGDVRLDRPHVTPYLDEGEASWVSLAAIEALERSPGEEFVWLRYTELLPPVVTHSRFRVPDALNERVAIETYLGRLCAFLRATDIDARVLVTDARAREVLVVGGGELIGSLRDVVMRAPALAGALYRAPGAETTPPVPADER